jgi:Rha family phage regulatory protein
MNNLVEIENNQVFTTSNIIGEEFGLMHKHILEKIESFTDEISAVRFLEMFQEFEYENTRKRKYKSFKINRDGYMFLVMNISNKKANNKKLMFIDAFNKMEKILLNSSSSEWITSREQGKQIRLNEVDTIKEFVEYAIKQGSTGAKFYYKHFTSSTYKALSLLEHKKPKTRDTLDLLQLHQLLLAEDLITRTIKNEMKNNEHYKVIFEKCKNALENFANSLFIGIKK